MTSISFSAQGKDLMPRNFNLTPSKAKLETAFKYCLRSLSLVLKTILLFYKSLISVHVGGGCRFEPSCSEYAIEASQRYDFFTALKFIFRRLSKCHPMGTFGFDPLPERAKTK
jgi:putative membrane protein insertion efficiency factor